MPRSVTHFLHAKKVLESFDENARKDINLNAWYWGAQGPDFFFCHRIMPFNQGASLWPYGTALHDKKPSEVFNAMRDFLRRNPDDIV